MTGGRVEVADAEFAALTNARIDRCYSLAGYLLGNAAEAEDATQDAMAKAWRARQTLRDPSQFEGWLDRIVVNSCMDRLRRRKIVRFVQIDEGEQVESSDPFGSLLSRDEVGTLLDLLTPEQRTVVVLRFWRDLQVEAIAERLGIPPGTVKSRLHSAIATLRHALESRGGR